MFNLKDANNPDLRAKVLQGELPPDRLVRMSANELASKDLRLGGG
jgi:transcription elongation factor S-II